MQYLRIAIAIKLKGCLSERGETERGQVSNTTTESKQASAHTARERGGPEREREREREAEHELQGAKEAAAHRGTCHREGERGST